MQAADAITLGACCARSVASTLIVVLFASAPLAGETTLPAAESRSVDFDRDIRPILAAHCYQCHGPQKQESGYRLDRKNVALGVADRGESPIVAGHSEKSPLVRFVSGVDAETLMPPKGEGKPLSSEQIGLLRAWVDQGAKWPDASDDPRVEIQKLTTDHWALQRVADVEPPKIDDPWITNGVDAFVLVRLREKELAPSPSTDRVTLIRRLSFDLHGLPPTPVELRQFVEDTGAEAYPRLVERLLASPRYGERWGQHWLDVVRFAESDGFEMNQERPRAWHYRDYVIKSFNADKPYDRFVFEQLAGDSVGENAATGFLVAGAWDRVTSPDIALTLMQRQDELADMTNTTGTAMLAMTMGCARCHNHKFDPILQKDYYSLQAVFAGVKHGERPLRNREHSTAQASAGELVYAGTFEQPKEPTHRLYRGDPLAPKEVVSPDVLSVLDSLGLAADTPEQQRRIALAKWVASPANPLTARVIVNRIWQNHFGAGIVDTPSDFGGNGSRPTHPELLDWLAKQLVEHDWSIKHIHRLILMSSTYRQTSRPNERGLAVDAGSRLLWRFPPRRLEAEAIRDSILQITGVLNLEMSGPGWSAFKPNNNYVRVYEPKDSFGPAEWRRMVYMQKIRMRQDGVFGAFDAPDGGQVCPKRGRSTTAIQALNLFNSGFMTQQAELFAERLKREVVGGTSDQVRRAFELAFNREARPNELAAAESLIAGHGMTAFCRAMLNANELMFIP